MVIREGFLGSYTAEYFKSSARVAKPIVIERSAKIYDIEVTRRACNGTRVCVFLSQISPECRRLEAETDRKEFHL